MSLGREVSQAVADRVLEAERRHDGHITLSGFVVILLEHVADVLLIACGVHVVGTRIERGPYQSLAGTFSRRAVHQHATALERALKSCGVIDRRDRCRTRSAGGET